MLNFKSIVPVLKVAELRRAIDFYQGVLGFTVVWQSANDGGGENAMLEVGATSILLTTGTHCGGTPNFTGVLYFNMTGVQEFFESIKSKVDIIWPLETMENGQLEFGIRDPDGYALAFAEEQQDKS